MHPLDGPRLKMRRAVSEIHRLCGIEEAFGRDSDYKVVRAKFNSKTGKYAYRIKVGCQPDLYWGVHIGEIAHNLRSALDGLVYQLVLANGKTPTRHTQFPIFLLGRTIKTRGKMAKGKATLVPHFDGMELADGRTMLKGVSLKHQAMIEGLQPYKRRNSTLAGHGRKNVLYLLRELNNADKHQLIQVVGGKPGTAFIETLRETVGLQTSRTFPNDSRIVEVSGPHFKVLKDGTKILEASPDVPVNSKVIPFVAFSEGCKAVKHQRVTFLLARIARQVEAIIETFASEFS